MTLWEACAHEIVVRDKRITFVELPVHFPEIRFGIHQNRRFGYRPFGLVLPVLKRGTKAGPPRDELVIVPRKD
jgi:hypothetical protein